MRDVGDEFLTYLEKIRWNNQCHCPYCGSHRATPYKHERRYHCLDCFTAYSVTVGTIFHKTHVHFKKWFYAIFLYIEHPEQLTSRKLARKIGVSKNTALNMIKRIKSASAEERKMFSKIAGKEDIENYF